MTFFLGNVLDCIKQFGQHIDHHGQRQNGDKVFPSELTPDLYPRILKYREENADTAQFDNENKQQT
jgi:hypothetical protein